MTGDDFERRLGRLEERLSTGVERLTRLEQRVADVDQDMKTVMSMSGTVITLTERLEVVRRQLDSLERGMQVRDETARKERREGRIALWSLTATIVAALIVASVTILTSIH